MNTIYDTLSGTLAVEPNSYNNIVSRLVDILTLKEKNMDALASFLLPSENESEADADPFDVVNRTAIIDISGYISQDLDWFERRYMGMTDLADVRYQIALADSHSEIDRIALKIDSSGGRIKGLRETMRVIRETEKPIYAVGIGTMASGGWFLASQADEIAVTPSTLSGSIGVIHVRRSMHGYLRNEGIKPIVFRNKEAKLKSPGHGDEEMTKEQIESIQVLIQDMFDKIRKETEEAREISKSALLGHAVFGESALDDEIADSFFNSFDDALEHFSNA